MRCSSGPGGTLVPILHRRVIEEDVRELVQIGIPHLERHYGSYSYNDLVNILEPVVQFHSFRSIIWMFARTLPEPGWKQESKEIREEAFYKEFRASQNIWSHEQIRDYSNLLGEPSLRDVPESWSRAARGVAYNLYHRIRQDGIWYPKVQRTKNVSQSTAIIYNLYAGTTKPVGTVTTKDLEVLYGETGFMCGGECELRSAWKFNDLKPRLYYCQGGRDYFASRYIKRFTQLLMDSIPICETRRRSHPERYLEQDLELDYVTTWDFKSFTTTLSELKFFLYALTVALEEMQPDPVRLFDYRHGVIEASIVDLLHHYNTQVNIQSPFSIHRIIQKYGYDEDISILYHQQNSGMLGVAGNIGCSTACHAFAILETVGPDKGSCVGDDAKSISRRHPEYDIIPAMQELGDIHPLKFTISPPGDEGPFKYIKRAFYRQPDRSFYRDPLFNLPLAPYVDGHTSHRDIIPSGKPHDFSRKVAIAIGGCIWEMAQSYELDNYDMEVFRHFLSIVYKQMRFPEAGFLPGFTLIDPHSSEAYVAQFALPSIQFSHYDPRQVDWLDYLCSHCVQPLYSLPVLGFYRPCIRPSVGEQIYAVKEKMWSAFEDMGYVALETMFEKKVILTAEGEMVMRRMIKKSLRAPGEGPLQRVTILKEIPSSFDSLFMDPASVYDSIEDIWESL